MVLTAALFGAGHEEFVMSEVRIVNYIEENYYPSEYILYIQE